MKDSTGVCVTRSDDRQLVRRPLFTYVCTCVDNLICPCVLPAVNCHLHILVYCDIQLRFIITLRVLSLLVLASSDEGSISAPAVVHCFVLHIMKYIE